MQCVYVNAEELSSLVAAGWRVVSGPHAELDDCEAVCVPSASGSGTGTTTLDPSKVITACCGGDTLPRTLAGSFYNRSGGCGCLPNQFLLEWDGSGWSASLIVPDCDDSPVSLRLTCTAAGAWSLTSLTCGFTRAPAFVQCDPTLRLLWANLTCPGVCGGQFDLSIGG